jgi:uncharacterized damage-inducible protein DinB
MAADIDLKNAQALRLERVATQLNALLSQPQVANHVQTHPGDGEWSVMQVLGHLAEMIPYWLDHCHRLVAASGEPLQFGRNLEATERLVGVERGATGDLVEMLSLVDHEIQVAVQTIREMSPADRARQGIHSRYGAINVAQVIERFIVAHAEEHLAQVQAILRG